jgi:hypothetical protein
VSQTGLETDVRKLVCWGLEWVRQVQRGAAGRFVLTAGVGVCRQDAYWQPAGAAAQQTVSEPEQLV